MLFATALLAATMALQAPDAQTPQRQTPRAPATDQTVSVTRGTRLSINNQAGEVIVHSWDRDAVRVRAQHGAGTKVNIRPSEGLLSISSGDSSAAVDYDLMVPAWMGVKVSGTFNFVTVEGVQSDISVETVRGDVVIKGASGLVMATSIEGEVIVEGAKGKVNVSSVNEDVKVSGASGEIIAETTNGDITLTGITSASVDIATVNGDIAFDGMLPNNGHYRMTTHQGDITLTVPETANATFTVRTYTGDFSNSLPTKNPPREEIRRGKRSIYTLGNGSAEVELETFAGTIRLQRPGQGHGGKN